MSKTVTTNINQTIAGDGFGGSGTLYTASQINASGVAPGSATLAAGANIIAVPATAAGVLIVPPVGSTNAKTLKGVAGDAGIVLTPAAPASLPFVAGTVASFVINSAGIETISLLWQ